MNKSSREFAKPPEKPVESVQTPQPTQQMPFMMPTQPSGATQQPQMQFMLPPGTQNNQMMPMMMPMMPQMPNNGEQTQMQYPMYYMAVPNMNYQPNADGTESQQQQMVYVPVFMSPQQMQGTDATQQPMHMQMMPQSQFMQAYPQQPQNPNQTK